MLLLDEPFGALDAQVRRELRRWLRQVHDRTGVTTVFVTHDQEEALDLADRVAVLKDGALVQVGEPHQVYAEPASSFVYDFLGAACSLPGVVSGGRLTVADWESPAPPGAPEGPVQVYFRPHEVSLCLADGAGFSARVLHAGLRGASGKIECTVGEAILELEPAGLRPCAKVTRGDTIRVTPNRYRLYPRAD
jgi:sulfate transport system ATP-binding protein